MKGLRTALLCKATVAILLVSAMASVQAANACIDTNPSGHLVNGVSVTFGDKDGQRVHRSNLVLRHFEPTNASITVDEGGQQSVISMAQWRQLKIDVDDVISPMAQRGVPQKREVGKLDHLRVPLSSLRIVDGIILFGACKRATSATPQEVLFNGTVEFQTDTGTVELVGVFNEYTMASPQGSNPGVRK